MRGRRWAAALLAGAGIIAFAVGLAGLWLWRWAWPPGGLAVTSVYVGGSPIAPCPGGLSAAPNGAGLDANIEGVVAADLVQVLSDLTQRGWRTTTTITASVELRPAEAPEFNLGLFRIRLYRGVTLAYTPERQTRVSSQTTIALCAP